jgi:serine/threonine-protein kinase
MDAWIGNIVGNYRILDWIGQGGMATVYKAWDLERKRLVAFKALFPFLTNDPSFRSRFEREAKILHRLRHPNIIPLLDFGEAEGLLYLVMPYITLGSLRDRLDESSVTVEQGSKIIRQIASALQFAHDRKIIHRDVKPSNILIDDNFNAWLSDFGFARMHDASMSITGSTLVGTPAYMAPEQILGHTTTPSSDQYALGVVLYQLATGHLPYEADTPMGLALKHATEPLPRPRAVNPKLPDAVEEVIIRALSKDSNFRYPTVTAFSDAFQAALYQIYDARSGKLKSGSIGPPPSQILEPVREALTSLTMPVVKTMKHRRVLPWVAGLLLLMLPVTALAFTIFNPTRPSAVAQVIDTTPQDVLLQQTADVLEADIASQSGDDPQGEGAVETAVAATMDALQRTPGTQAASGAGGTLEITGTITVFSSTQVGTITATTGLPGSTLLPSASPTKNPAGTSSLLPSPTGAGIVPSPTPNPPASPSSSPTSSPTSAPPPTDTDEPPAPTSTNPPAPTIAPTATNPPADPCAALSIGGFNRDGKTVGWSLTNDSSSSQTVKSIHLTWPGDNQALFKVDLSGSTVWVGDEPVSPTSISAWIGGETSRTFTGGQPIQFRFKANAVDGSYGLVVDFVSGCRLSR